MAFSRAGVAITGKRDTLWHVQEGTAKKLNKPKGEVNALRTFGGHYLCFNLDGPRVWDVAEDRCILHGDSSLGGPLGVWLHDGDPCVCYKTHIFHCECESLQELPLSIVSGNVVSGRLYGRAKAKDAARTGCWDVLTGELLWESSEQVIGIHWADEETGFLRYRDRVEHVALATGDVCRQLPPAWNDSRVHPPFVLANGRVYDFHTEQCIFDAPSRTVVSANLTDGLLWCAERAGERYDKKHHHSLVCYSLEQGQEAWRMDVGSTSGSAEVRYGVNHAGFFRVDRKSVELFAPV